MKKKFFICLMSFLICGCSTHSSKEENQFQTYDYIKNKLIQQVQYDQTIDCQVSLIFNKLSDNYRYDIVIHQPQKDMYHITAMCYASEGQDKICPNIGIFDEQEYHLKKDYVDKQNGFYKGIQLSGTVKRKQSIKLYISYYIDSSQTKKIEKYIEVLEE